MSDGAYAFWLVDLDGTVVDVHDAYIQEVVRAVGDRLGCGFSAAEARRLWYEDEAARGAVLEAHDCDPAAFWRTYHQVEAPAARAEATFVYDDAEAFLTALDVPVGVVTHCQSYLTEPILAHLDIADWFDTVVCCDEEIGWKPDPRPVELAVAGLEMAAPAPGALVGDGPADVAAAHNAGLAAVHVTRGAGTGERPSDVDARRVAALTELRA